MEWHKDDFLLSDDRAKIDLDMVHTMLDLMPWSKGISREKVARSIDQSLCLGVYKGGDQVGFGRAITDRATFAYLDDLFIVEGWRGVGLSKWLLSCFLEHPELQGLRRWMLATTDAHTLYEKQGFRALNSPEWFMEIDNSGVYTAG